MTESRNLFIDAVLAMLSALRAAAIAGLGHVGRGCRKRHIEALEELLGRGETGAIFGAKPLGLKEK